MTPILLGVADRVSPVGVLAPAHPLDVVGLRRVVTSSIYPLDLRNLAFVFAFPRGGEWNGDLLFRLPGGNELRLKLRFDGTGPVLDDSEWLVVGVSLRQNEAVPTLIFEPGTLSVFARSSAGEEACGTVWFAYQAAPDLTAEQRSAVQSNPLLNRAVRLDLRCTACGDAITPYCALDRGVRADDASNLVWYRDLPELFSCTCQKSAIPLRYLRESMHVLLAMDGLFLPDGTIATTAQISVAETNRILDAFAALLDSEPPEETVQKFMEAHPLVLAPFAARHLFFKPPILTGYRADFGIVDARKELLLIEIERPNLKLLRSDGSPSAELTKALAQPNSWRQVVTEHKRAVLESIRNCPKDIVRVRYLVVAGRSAAYRSDLLDRLQLSAVDPEIMTYDQLIERARSAVRAATA